jgi:hypothetical protein
MIKNRYRVHKLRTCKWSTRKVESRQSQEPQRKKPLYGTNIVRFHGDFFLVPQGRGITLTPWWMAEGEMCEKDISHSEGYPQWADLAPSLLSLSPPAGPGAGGTHTAAWHSHQTHGVSLSIPSSPSQSPAHLLEPLMPNSFSLFLSLRLFKL